MNMPKENSPTDQTKNKKYAFVQREGDDFSCIKLLQPPYKGVIYKYGKVGFARGICMTGQENPKTGMFYAGGVVIVTESNEQFKSAYIEATTGIATPSKGLIL